MRRLIALMALAGAIAAPAAPPPSRDFPIAMQGMHFGPSPPGLRVGDTILWLNRDIVAHTATARDHSFDVTLQPHHATRITLRHAGTIVFSCRFHPTMQGVLTVAGR